MPKRKHSDAAPVFLPPVFLKGRSRCNIISPVPTSNHVDLAYSYINDFVTAFLNGPIGDTNEPFRAEVSTHSLARTSLQCIIWLLYKSIVGKLHPEHISVNNSPMIAGVVSGGLEGDVLKEEIQMCILTRVIQLRDNNYLTDLDALKKLRYMKYIVSQLYSMNPSCFKKAAKKYNKEVDLCK